MSDEPLDPATLSALRSALFADSPPEIEPGAWSQMLRDTFGAPRGIELHGDLAGEDLVPLDWPDLWNATPEPPSPMVAGVDVGDHHAPDGGPDWSDPDTGGEHMGGHDPGHDDGGHAGGGDLT